MTAYQSPYTEWRQSIDRAPTEWEIALASAVEDAFGKGRTELGALVEALNNSRVRPREGGTWTAERFVATMDELGV